MQLKKRKIEDTHTCVNIYGGGYHSIYSMTRNG